MGLLSQFFPERWIELVVDGYLLQQERGPRCYEYRELNSIQQALEALAFSVAHREKTLSVEHIKQIHSIALKNVKGLRRGSEKNVGLVRANTGVYFFIWKSGATVEGIEELLLANRGKTNAKLRNLENINFLSPDNTATATDIYNNMVDLLYEAPTYSTREDLENALNDIVQSYNSSIDAASTQLDKLKVIVAHIKQLELLHPFSDGNGRTFVNVLLNSLLIKNKFYPAIFFDPNIFDLYSTSQIVNVVIEGMWFFEYAASNPEKPLFYNHTEQPLFEKERLAAMSRSLREALATITNEEEFARAHTLIPKDSELLNLWHIVTDNFEALSSLEPAQVNCMMDKSKFGAPHHSALTKNLHAIHIAARFGHIKILEWMIGVSKELVNLPSLDGRTALDYAAAESDMDTVNILLSNGADMSLVAGHYAAQSGRKDVFQFFFSQLLINPSSEMLPHLMTWFLLAITDLNIDVIELICDWLEDNPKLLPDLQQILLIIETQGVKRDLENTPKEELYPQINNAFNEVVISSYTRQLSRLLSVGQGIFIPFLAETNFKESISYQKKAHFFLLSSNGVTFTRKILDKLIADSVEKEWLLEAIRLPAVTSEMLNYDLIFLHTVVLNYGNCDDVLDSLFSKGFSPYPLSMGNSILHHLTGQNGLKFLQYLKRKNRLDDNELNRLGDTLLTPLTSALYRNEEKIAQFFLENGANANVLTIRAERHLGVIEKIAETGTLVILKLALQYLSQEDAVKAINNVKTQHPLLSVLHRQEFAMAQVLLSHGCNLDTKFSATDQTLREKIAQEFPLAIRNWVNEKDRTATIKVSSTSIFVGAASIIAQGLTEEDKRTMEKINNG